MFTSYKLISAFFESNKFMISILPKYAVTAKRVSFVFGWIVLGLNAG